MRTHAAAIVLVFFNVSVLAGDLDNLPDTEKAFNEKIEAFIKSGSKVKDAVSLLEAFRFKCEAIKNDKTAKRCSRADKEVLRSEVRHYQVILISQDKRIKRVKTFTGLENL